MNYFSKQRFLNIRRTLAQVLVLALLIAFLPQRSEAKYQDLSGTLPGVISGKEVAAIAIAGGAVIGVAIFLLIKRHKKPPKNNLNSAPPPAKSNDPAPLPQSKGVPPVINPMTDPIAVPCTDACMLTTKGELQ